MTPQEFPLRKGSILFEKDQINITDNAASTRKLMLFSSGLWFFIGISKIYAFSRNGERFDLVFGILLIVLQSIVFIIYNRRSTAKTISWSEINSIKVRQSLANRYLDIRLKNGKARRVENLGHSASAIENFVKSYNNSTSVAVQ